MPWFRLAVRGDRRTERESGGARSGYQEGRRGRAVTRSIDKRIADILQASSVAGVTPTSSMLPTQTSSTWPMTPSNGDSRSSARLRTTFQQSSPTRTRRSRGRRFAASEHHPGLRPRSGRGVNPELRPAEAADAHRQASPGRPALAARLVGVGRAGRLRGGGGLGSVDCGDRGRTRQCRDIGVRAVAVTRGWVRSPEPRSGIDAHRMCQSVGRQDGRT